jgi:hypothetical protein
MALKTEFVYWKWPLHSLAPEPLLGWTDLFWQAGGTMGAPAGRTGWAHRGRMLGVMGVW